jgi:ribosome-associated protein
LSRRAVIIRIVIRLSNHICIAESELEERFVCASGPGGQNVNKVATAVELRFDVRRSPNLPEPVRVRLERLAGRRLTKDGVLVIRADRFRTQEQNRADARARLAALVRRAAVPPKVRVKTRPTRGANERRLKAKGHRGLTKRTRQTKPSLE